MYNPETHHRRSIRLKEYDYSSQGMYFITICTYNHQAIFGNIINGISTLNKNGEIVKQIWEEMPQKYKNVICHEFVIMPNHIHGIIQFIDIPTKNQQAHSIKGGQTPPLQSTTLGKIIGCFKYTTTKLINPNKKLWQRNYYEHIIRNQNSYEEIAAYIIENPLHWKKDQLYIEI